MSLLAAGSFCFPGGAEDSIDPGAACGAA